MREIVQHQVKKKERKKKILRKKSLSAEPEALPIDFVACSVRAQVPSAGPADGGVSSKGAICS